MTDTAPVLTIHERMAAILGDLPAIGKDQRNAQQNFMYRGYDDVLNALNPLLTKYQVFFLPRVLDRTESVRRTNAGGNLYVVNLHVRFRFYGPDGEYVEADSWGEGTDSGDKATNKAMTGALKYVLFQVFAISTKEVADADADRSSPPESERQLYECPRCEKEGSHYEHIDLEKFRTHMVDKHGYRRLEDGRVAAPSTGDEQARTGDPATDPKTEDVPDDGGRPLPPAKTDGTEETHDTGTAQDAAPSSTTEAKTPDNGSSATDTRLNPQTMSKPEVVMALRERNLPTNGRVEDLRLRLVGAVFAEETGTTRTEADEHTAPPQTPAAASAPVEPNGSRPSLAMEVSKRYGIDTDTFIKDGVEHACPNCDVFSFDSEGDYFVHWYTTHSDDADALQREFKLGKYNDGLPRSKAAPAETTTAQTEAPPASPAPAPAEGTEEPATAEMVAEVKTGISSLSGDAVRKYARTRREKAWPSPDKLTMTQALDVIDFLESLSESASA